MDGSVIDLLIIWNINFNTPKNFTSDGLDILNARNMNTQFKSCAFDIYHIQAAKRGYIWMQLIFCSHNRKNILFLVLHALHLSLQDWWCIALHLFDIILSDCCKFWIIVMSVLMKWLSHITDDSHFFLFVVYEFGLSFLYLDTYLDNGCYLVCSTWKYMLEVFSRNCLLKYVTDWQH